MYNVLKHFIPAEYLMILAATTSLISTIYFIKLFIKAHSYQKMGLAAFIFLTSSLFFETIFYFINTDIMKILFLFSIIIFPIWFAIGGYISYIKGDIEQRARVKKGLTIIGLTVVSGVIFFTIMYLIT